MGGVGVSGYWLAIDTATDIASVAVGRRAGAGPVQAGTGAPARGARRHAPRVLRLGGVPAAGGAAVKLGPVPIAACFDALRGQVYGAIYVVHPGRVETLVPPAVLTVPELARIAPVRPQLVVGDGAMLYADVVRAWSGADPVPLAALPPAASVMLSLFTREGATRVIADPVTAEPVYGRPAEAQVKWEARHGRPLPDPSRPRR